MMMRTNHTVALTPAQPQPLASSRPKNARLRTTVPPGPSACSAICPPSRAAAGPPPACRAGYLTVSVPVMFGWTTQVKPYVPAGSAGTSYVWVATPVMMAPCQTIGPVGEPVWIATLWGIPASLLVNLIWNATPAGAVRSVVSNALLAADSARTVPVAPPDAAGSPAGAPEGAALAVGAPLPAGAALAAALGAAGAADLNASFQQAGTGVAPAGAT